MNPSKKVNHLRNFKRYSRTDNTPIKILHVDDDLNQLFFTKIFLEECDPKLIVVSTSHPKDVEYILSKERYDCLVSDYQMDEMNGIKLVEIVRKKSGVPIIIYTGRGSEEIEGVARVAGADGYVQKNTDPKHYKNLYTQILYLIHKDYD